MGRDIFGGFWIGIRGQEEFFMVECNFGILREGVGDLGMDKGLILRFERVGEEIGEFWEFNLVLDFKLEGV